MAENKNILITSAGQRVSLVRSFQAELKKTYPNAKVLAIDVCPELSAACQVADEYFKVKPVSHKEYIIDLLMLCKKHNIGMVVPTIDTELLVLASHKELFSATDIHLIVPDAAFVAICRDKRKTHAFFRQHHVEAPVLYSKDDPIFPLFIKPYDGSLSIDTFVITKKEDLTEYHLTNERLLFMEYLDKGTHTEYTIDAYYGRDNKLKCAVPRKRILVRAGEINKGVTAKNEILDFIRKRLVYIPDAIGCLTIQVFLNNESGKITAIEINPRFGGGYPLSYRAGANYPAFLIKEYFKGESLAYTDDWEDNLLMLRYDDEILVHDYQADK